MRAAVSRTVAPAGASRLLADVKALGEYGHAKRTPALIRLEAALGRDFTDRLLTALSDQTSDGRR